MGVVAHLVVKVSASVSEFEKQFGGINAAWNRLGKQMQSVGSSLTQSVTLPIVGIGSAAMKTGMDFERVMNQIQGTMRPTAAQMKTLRQTSLQMGADTAFSASDAATAMLELGKAGFTIDQSLSSVDEVLQLAAASGLSMGDAAELTARTMAQFGLGIGEVGHVNDVLAQAVNSSTLKIEDVGTAFGYVGPLARDFGMSVEDVAASIATMRDAGVASETAGRTLRESLGRLANPTSAMEKAMLALGIQTFKTADGSLRPMSEIIGMLERAGAKAPEALKLFGDAAGPGMNALITQGQGALERFSASLKDSSGASKAMADAMMSGMPGAFEKMKGSIETALIAISTAIGPAMIPIMDMIGKIADLITNIVIPAFQALPTPVQAVILGLFGLAVALGPIAWWVGTVITAWTSLVALFPGVGLAATSVARLFSGVFTASLSGVATFLTTTLPAAFMSVIAFLGPQGLIALAVLALAAIWWKWGDQIKAVVSGAYAAIKEWFVDKFEGTIIMSVARLLASIVELFVAIVVRITQEVMKVFTAAKTWLLDKLEPVVTAIGVVIGKVASVFTTVKDAVITVVMAMYNGLKVWLLDKFGAIVDGVKAKIDAVTGFFKGMADAVTLHSYVPDMVTEIGHQFGPRLHEMMVTPASLATSMVLAAFRGMKQEVQNIVSGLIYDLSGMLEGWLDGFLPSWAARLIGGMANAAMQAGTSALLGLAGLGGGGMGGMMAGGGGMLGGLIGGGANASAAGVLSGSSAIAGVGGAGSGIGLGATIGITGGIGAAALLGWAVWKKGLFRGGEEALQVNPRRDQFLAQFGPPGTGIGSGFHNLAAALTGLTGEPGGGGVFRALTQSDTLAEFRRAETDIAAALGGDIQVFHQGGMVPGNGTVPALLLGGERVLNRAETADYNAGAGLTVTINAIDARGVAEFVESGSFLAALQTAVRRDRSGIRSGLSALLAT